MGHKKPRRPRRATPGNKHCSRAHVLAEAEAASHGASTHHGPRLVSILVKAAVWLPRAGVRQEQVVPQLVGDCLRRRPEVAADPAAAGVAAVAAHIAEAHKGAGARRDEVDPAAQGRGVHVCVSVCGGVWHTAASLVGGRHDSAFPAGQALCHAAVRHMRLIQSAHRRRASTRRPRAACSSLVKVLGKVHAALGQLSIRRVGPAVEVVEIALGEGPRDVVAAAAAAAAQW